MNNNSVSDINNNSADKFKKSGQSLPDSDGDMHEQFGLSRREFMRLLSMSMAGVFTGSLAGCGELWERQPAIEVDSWHQSACRFCGTGCGIQIGMRDGKVVDVKGDDRAHNRGRLCIKGLLTREILYVEDRALYPMIRKNGTLERVSWEEVMGLIGERFKESIRKKGPDSVAFYGSGQLFTEESYVANKLFKAGIGTNNVDGNPRLCMASAAAGYTSVFGKDEPMGCYEDIDHADCFFITGSNTAECHPIVFERVLDRKRAHPDTFIIVVDPRKTIVGMGTTATVLETTKTVQSCNSCHVMNPFVNVNDLKDPESTTLAARHYKNKWIPKNQCYTCHITYGAHGTFEGKRDGFRHWLLYVTQTWEEPIQYSGTYPNSNCLSCHGGTLKFATVTSHRSLFDKLNNDEINCTDCHGPAHPLPGERTALKENKTAVKGKDTVGSKPLNSKEVKKIEDFVHDIR